MKTLNFCLLLVAFASCRSDSSTSKQEDDKITRQILGGFGYPYYGGFGYGGFGYPWMYGGWGYGGYYGRKRRSVGDETQVTSDDDHGDKSKRQLFGGFGYPYGGFGYGGFGYPWMYGGWGYGGFYGRKRRSVDDEMAVNDDKSKRQIFGGFGYPYGGFGFGYGYGYPWMGGMYGGFGYPGFYGRKRRSTDDTATIDDKSKRQFFGGYGYPFGYGGYGMGYGMDFGGMYGGYGYPGFYGRKRRSAADDEDIKTSGDKASKRQIFWPPYCPPWLGYPYGYGCGWGYPWPIIF